MSTSFPTSLDALTNPTPTDTLDSVTVPHADQHANANDAIEALETKVGIDGSADAGSIDYRLAATETIANTATSGLANHDHAGGDGALIPHTGIDANNSPSASALLSYDDITDKFTWLTSVYYQPTTLTTTVGTVTGGDVNSVLTKSDANILEITEVGGSTPGFDVRFDFASVVTFNELRVNMRYSGGHNCELQLWDYTLGTPAYVTQTTVNNQTGLVDVTVPIDNSTKYIDGSGNAKMRFYHPAAGVGTHLFKCDFLGLIYAVTGGGGVTDHQALSGTTNAGAHPATAVSVSGSAGLTATDVQAALLELNTEKIEGQGTTLIVVSDTEPVGAANGTIWLDTSSI